MVLTSSRAVLGDDSPNGRSGLPLPLTCRTRVQQTNIKPSPTPHLGEGEGGNGMQKKFILPFSFLRCGQGQGDENFWLFVFIRRCACEAPVLTEWPPHRGVKSGQTSGRGLREARISAGCSCLEWAGYLKWPDCPLFMTSCPTAQIVFATFTHLKGQRRKDVEQIMPFQIG